MQGSSAFMIDLQQISFALRNATARSLVIVDEFGKGTEAGDGAGLFCGVMDFLARRGSDTVGPASILSETRFIFTNANDCELLFPR